MYLSYFGLRVRDLERSARFYSSHFGLRPVPGSDLPTAPPKEQATVLLIDAASGQRLELNFYPPGNPYAVPYVPGEGLDHLAFRVDDLDATLRSLHQAGVEPEPMAHFDGPMMSTPTFRVAYVRDPDGNQLELYDTPGSPELRYRPETY